MIKKIKLFLHKIFGKCDWEIIEPKPESKATGLPENYNWVGIGHKRCKTCGEIEMF